MAEEWAKRFRDETKAAQQARDTAEDHLSVLRTQQKQLAEQVKKANQDKASAEAGRNNMEKQAETFRSELHLCQINLETEKQMVIGCTATERGSRGREASFLCSRGGRNSEQVN